MRDLAFPDLLEFRRLVKLGLKDSVPLLTFLSGNCQRRGERFECVRTSGCLQSPRHEISGSH